MRLGEVAKFVWLQRSTTRESDFGADEETFTENGELWGTLRPLGSNERIAEGAKSSAADFQIELNNVPGVKATDRLRNKATSVVYVIDGVHPNAERTKVIVKAHRYEQP